MRAIAAKLPLVKLADVDRTEAWFLRHGVKAVFFGRMIPIFRSLISIPAGVERMPVWTFLLYTTLGSLIWNTIFVMAGYLLGENWHVVESYVGTFQNVVILGCVAALGWFVFTRVRRARQVRDLPEAAVEVDVPVAPPAVTPVAEYSGTGYRGTVYRSGAWRGGENADR